VDYFLVPFSAAPRAVNNFESLPRGLTLQPIHERGSLQEQLCLPLEVQLLKEWPYCDFLEGKNKGLSKPVGVVRE
jgi:hypothetical protein